MKKGSMLASVWWSTDRIYTGNLTMAFCISLRDKLKHGPSAKHTGTAIPQKVS